VHAAEHDELGVGPGRRVARELEGVAGDVGERDDLVALIVVAEDEDTVAERSLRRARSLDEARVARRGQVAGALHPALGVGVGAAAEQQQGQRGGGGLDEALGRHTPIMSRVSRALTADR